MNTIFRKSASAALVSAVLLCGFTATHAQDNVRHYVDSQGREVTLRTGQPAPDHYGPKPEFAQLDRNRDGAISRDEAEAYPPLSNDFDYIAHGAGRISARQYAQWKYP